MGKLPTSAPIKLKISPFEVLASFYCSTPNWELLVFLSNDSHLGTLSDRHMHSTSNSSITVFLHTLGGLTPY